MFQVLKRDGEIADFEMKKITDAIKKAFTAKEKQYKCMWSMRRFVN